MFEVLGQKSKRWEFFFGTTNGRWTWIVLEEVPWNGKTGQFEGHYFVGWHKNSQGFGILFCIWKSDQ